MDTVHHAPGLTSILSLTRTPGVALFANSTLFPVQYESAQFPLVLSRFSLR